MGSISVHAGSAESCKQCSVAAESTRATGVMGVDTTEIVDKHKFLGLSSVMSVPRRQAQLRVDPPCILLKVALATWLGPGVKHSLPTWAQLPCV